jgi:WD40 repeat protein
MNWQLKCICFFLAVLIMASCQAVGESPQATAPGEIEPILQSPSQVPTQMSFPEMTGTAQAFPTVIYPTETPLTPEDIFSLSERRTTSPDGKYVITCEYSVPTLFHVPTKTVISTTDKFFGCDQNSSWSPDSSYVFFTEASTGDLYRWRVDGSQPEFLEINTVLEPKKLHYPDCSAKKMSWSPDGRYLAIHKCDLYVLTPADEETFKHPLLIVECSGCFEDFRWITPRVLLVNYSKVLSLVHIPSGNRLVAIFTSGGLCAEQLPLFPPDGRWIVSDLPFCGGGGVGPNQSVIASMEDGSTRVFSESFADRIDLVGWSPDSSQLYLVSRPMAMDALPDPRTPFGLLALDPETLQVQNIFEQAWFVSFNQDFRWAYVVFPSKNDDGSFHLEGGLWMVGTSQLLGRQTMTKGLDDRFLEPVPYFSTQPFYSFTGEELGYSSTAAGRLVPAVWSHDNSKLATINAEHGLIVIDVQGEIRTIAQLQPDQEWFNAEIQWSDDDRSVAVDGVTWTVP